MKLAEITSRLTQAGFGDQATYLLDAAEDVSAFSVSPFEHAKKIRSNTPLERLQKEIRRCIDEVGNFPNGQAVIRLVDAAV